jgi:hypothetical protein
MSVDGVFAEHNLAHFARRSRRHRQLLLTAAVIGFDPKGFDMTWSTVFQEYPATILLTSEGPCALSADRNGARSI